MFFAGRVAYEYDRLLVCEKPTFIGIMAVEFVVFLGSVSQSEKGNQDLRDAVIHRLF